MRGCFFFLYCEQLQHWEVEIVMRRIASTSREGSLTFAENDRSIAVSIF